MDDLLELDYSSYYSDDIESFGLCDSTYLKEFGKKFLPTVYSIVAILGILANAVLIFISIKHAGIRKISVLCMSISDLLFGATLPFLAVYAHFSQWIFGQLACKVITFFYTLTMFSSNFSFAFMCLERYYSAFSRLCSIRIIKISVRNMAALFVLILSVLASTPHVYFVEAVEHDGHHICTYHHEHTWRTFMKFEENIVGFVVPFVIICVCSVRISYHAMKKFPNKRCGVLKQEMAFAVTFFVLWLPYHVIVFLHALQDLHIVDDCITHQHLHLAVQLTECLAFTHVFVNPVLYAMQNKKIRKFFKRSRTGTAEFLIESSTENPAGVELTAVHTTGNFS